MFISTDSILDNENALAPIQSIFERICMSCSDSHSANALSPIFLIPNPNFTFLKLRHPKKAKSLILNIESGNCICSIIKLFENAFSPISTTSCPEIFSGILIRLLSPLYLSIEI